VIAFGPVPSRRLGRSLGINPLSGKFCTYSCVYCQVGRTNHLRTRRRDFRSPEDVLRSVSEKVEAAVRRGESVDYLTFVPDGEPTLDRRLGAMIRMLRPVGLPIAVLTNGSLLDREDVREDLGEADWVSVKVDTVDRERWRTANRPHGSLRLPSILDGMRAFADGFRRRLVTETMLLDGVNDGEAELRATASFIGALNPNRAYLAVPTRPPAESWVTPPSALNVARAYEVFRAGAGRVELLAGYEGDAFAATGDPREDLLAIMAVHPMREEAVARFLRRSGRSRLLIDEMVRRRELVRVVYGGQPYCLRPILPTARSPATEEPVGRRRWSPSRRHWHPWI
jgi:wyosine [tRNA(Phe)-imidazoG37] synthetase (radical SAM superfamily)